MYTILRNDKDLAYYRNQINHTYITTPTKYPALLFILKLDPEFTWNSEGCRVSRRYETLYIYPDDIQKELYNSDFEALIK